MPAELLPTVITSLQNRIEVGFPFKNDQTGLLVGCSILINTSVYVPHCISK